MSDSIIEEQKEEISFEDLGLDGPVLEAIEKKGFKVPSPIQVLAIPRLLNGDTNLIAKARTGTGKTAAFGLPIVRTCMKNLTMYARLFLNLRVNLQFRPVQNSSLLLQENIRA